MRVWTTVIGQHLDNAQNTRSMLLCEHLRRRGHEVTMWTSAFEHIRKQWHSEWRAVKGGLYTSADGLDIRFMKGCGYRNNISPMRYLDHYLAARDFLRSAHKLPPPDVIVASLPDHLTAAAAVNFGASRRIPVIVDVRDKWPDIFIYHAANPLVKGLARAVLSMELMDSKRTLQRADAIVAMMQTMMDWALEKAKRAPSELERIFFLAPSPKNFDVPPIKLPKDGPSAKAIKATRGKTVIAYIGTFNRTEHPLLLIDAIDHLSEQGVNDPDKLAFIIGGDGVDAGEVRRRAERHPNVHCLGWLTPPEIYAILANSDIGVLSMNVPSPAFNNKSFSYLASGLAIINGATGDLAELIETEKLGVNISAGNPKAMADAIISLTGNAARLAEIQANVKRVFLERFDRDANYEAYAAHVEKVVEVFHQRGLR